MKATASTPQIQIPVPCHENWDAMSPQEKGRFCGVCSKKVVDFSGQKKAEIADYLATQETGSVCGRIPANLLDKMPAMPIPHVQKVHLSRFAFAAILVFGNFLFGFGQSSEMDLIMGDIAYLPPVKDTLSLKDSLQNNIPLPVIDTTVYIWENEPEPVIMGMMVAPVPEMPVMPEPVTPVEETPVQTTPPPVPTEPDQPRRPMIMGKMMVVPQQQQPPEKKNQ